MVPPIGCSLTLYNVEMFLGFRSLPIYGARRYLSYDRSSGATIDRNIDRLWLPLVVRYSTIVVDRATTRTTTRTTNRTTTYHQQERPIAVCDRFWRSYSKHCRSVARSPNSNQSYDQQIVRSGVTVALLNPYSIPYTNTNPNPNPNHTPKPNSNP